MFNRLKSRFILMVLGGAVLAILLVSIITNVTLFNEFDVYMKSEQEDRLEALIELIKQAYSLDYQWSDRAIEHITFSPIINDFDIVIKDANQKKVFTSYMGDSMEKMHNEMMKRMGHRMGNDMHKNMMRNREGEVIDGQSRQDYVSKIYILTVDDEEIGTVEVGYIGPFIVSERDIKFTKGINTAILYATVISLIVSIFIGLYSSKVFSDPILEITKAANEIRQGNLDTQVKKGNNIEELKELSDSINHLARSLKEQENLRKRLTSDVSHELRTPLTVLLSHIEAISDGIWEPTEEKLSICKNEVNRLIKLVEQLKYLTDIESHKIQLELTKHDLSRNIKEIIVGYEQQFKEKGVVLQSQIDDNVLVYGDQDRLKQVIINLLSNGLKFTSKGGEVKVSLRDKGKNIIITVVDTGIGIEKEDLPYIFERFYRSDQSRSRKTGGSGIGLTITKSIIDAHGGKISVKSQKNKGTQFIIYLPKELN